MNHNVKNENSRHRTKDRNLERDEKQNQESNHTQNWLEQKQRRRKRNLVVCPCWWKKGTLKQLKLTNVSLYKERHGNCFYHSKKKKKKRTEGFKQSHARILCCLLAALLRFQMAFCIQGCFSLKVKMGQCAKSIVSHESNSFFRWKSAGGIPGTLF